jgi:hypothetical protein
MASTDIVLAHATYLWYLVAALAIRVVFSLVFLVATFLLARRNGQKVTKVSWSFLHGFTAEFDTQSGLHK